MLNLYMVATGGGDKKSPWWGSDAGEACLMAERNNAGRKNVEQYTAKPATIAEYRAWYADTVGYDPMAEMPPMAEAEFLALCREYVETDG